MSLTNEQRLRSMAHQLRDLEKQVHEIEHLKTSMEGKLMHVSSDVVQLRKQLDELKGGQGNVGAQEQRSIGTPAAGVRGPSETVAGGDAPGQTG